MLVLMFWDHGVQYSSEWIQAVLDNCIESSFRGITSPQPWTSHEDWPFQEFRLPAVCWMIKREIGSKTNGITEKMDRFWGQTWCTTPYSVPIGPGDRPVSRPLSWWRTGIPHDLRNPQFTIWHPCAFAPLSKFPHQDRKYTCSWRKYLILATRVQGTTIYSKNLALQCPFELPIRR